MKILLLTPVLDSGGVETGTIDLSKSLKSLGQDVVVVSSGGSLVKELEEHNIKHIELPIHKKSLLTLLQIPRLIKIIKDEQADIVHAQSRVPAWVAYFACKNTSAAFITSCHGYYSKQMFSNVMGWGKRVIVISQAIAKHMHDDFRVNKEKIRLVYRGVDLSRYHFKKKDIKTAKDKFVIVNIARITPIKGQSEFIKAISIVEKQVPNIEVWLVGSSDNKKRNYEIKLHRLVKDLNLKDKVKFLGKRSDIPQILSDSDLLVLSTQMPEAFGRVIIEAGACGVPVCATKIGGIVEIIEDNKDGLLFNYGDVDSMARAIVKMLGDSALRHKCANNLLGKVKNEFSLEDMSRNTLEVYKEVVSEKNILVIKLGGLGDLILATPSLRMLRRHFPDSRISLLIDRKFKQLVEQCPYVDDLVLFDRKKDSLFKLIKELRRRGFDLAVDLKNSDFTHWLAFLSGITLRYGFCKGFLSRFLLNHCEPLSLDSTEDPVKQQFRILQKMGVSYFYDELELWPSIDDYNLVDGLLKKHGVLKDDKLIGLSISASPEWPTKNWPIENYYELSNMLIKRGLKVVLIGTAHSNDKLLIFGNDKVIINFIGETNLNQLVSLIKRLNILVTPDSAPMHIASATGTKLIALFGPTDPKRHSPPRGKIDTLVRQLDCQPCYKRNCANKEQIACLKNISSKEVFDLIIERVG
jgi:lipopolysaccharide heptosyltransferase II